MMIDLINWQLVPPASAHLSNNDFAYYPQWLILMNESINEVRQFSLQTLADQQICEEVLLTWLTHVTVL